MNCFAVTLTHRGIQGRQLQLLYKTKEEASSALWLVAKHLGQAGKDSIVQLEDAFGSTVVVVCADLDTAVMVDIAQSAAGQVYAHEAQQAALKREVAGKPQLIMPGNKPIMGRPTGA